MIDKKSQTPSLLEPQSQGGDTAETGFDFQTNLILCKIPFWLSIEGFDSLMREGTADIEAKFFAPSDGLQIEALEAKNHYMAPQEFWEEIERFIEMDAGSPGTFKNFTLCCTGVSEQIKPLINGLRRIRDPQTFYDESSAIIENSYADYAKRILKLGKTEDIAKFLYEKVQIETNWNMISDEQTARTFFRSLLQHHLPEYEELPGKEISNIFPCLLDLLRSNKARPITRLQIEETIQTAISEKHHVPVKPIVLFTEIDSTCKKEKALQFEWKSFFGGTNRQYPPEEDWNSKLVPQLDNTLKWIKDHRNSRRIELKGNRRISAAIALGKIFSSVSGFAIDMDYRGDVWSTDDYPNKETPDYSISTSFIEGTEDCLVVTIGIMKQNIAFEVESFLQNEKMSHLPRIHLFSSQPIISAKQANAVVEKIKKEITIISGRIGAKQLHLFYAGPAHLALFLGHRWNTLPPVQCFEWVASNNYVPTCSLY